MTGCDAYRLRLSSDKSFSEMRRPRTLIYAMHYPESDDLEHGAQAVVIGRRFEQQELNRVTRPPRPLVNPRGRAGRQVRVLPCLADVAEIPGYDLHFEKEKCIAGMTCIIFLVV